MTIGCHLVGLPFVVQKRLIQFPSRRVSLSHQPPLCTCPGPLSLGRSDFAPDPSDMSRLLFSPIATQSLWREEGLETMRSDIMKLFFTE
jgi:hypothetical protein